MQLVDGLEQFIDLVSVTGNILLKLSVRFIAALDLLLQILNCAVDVADGALRFTSLVFLLFQLTFKLI